MTREKKDSKPRWAYMLRILGRNPYKFPLDRISEYLKEFADLLGAENEPTFGGVKNASTGIAARVPEHRVHYAHTRIVTAKNEPGSRPGKALGRIQKAIDLDGIGRVELLDSGNNVVLRLEGKSVSKDKTPTIYQSAEVDGMVTGVVGADDTMHLYLRDYLDRDMRILVKDEALARDLLTHFRKGVLRVTARGTWKRTEYGWLPEANKCTAISFEVLSDTPVGDVLAQFVSVPGNGWKELANPDQHLSELRGEE